MIKRFFLLFIVLLAAVPATAQDDWQVEAAARIEQHRKENVQIIVMVEGKPVHGAKVEIKMQRHEFLFGCGLGGQWNQYPAEKNNEDYRRQFAELFNFTTLPFYWKSYEPKQGEPDYAKSERLATWCRENQITLKGHPLVWNRTPEWLDQWTSDEILHRTLDRVTDCASHFANQIEVWDVVNEFSEWSDKQSQNHSPKLVDAVEQYGKINFIKECFLAARKGNPNALLLINDLDARYAGLIEQLVAANDGKPVFDAIGIQSHMHAGIWDNDKIWNTCETFARFGVPLHFTEMTILSTQQKVDWTPTKIATSDDGEQFQKEHLIRIYTLLFSHPSVSAITWWNFTDLGAWRDVPAGLLRNDMSPKPAYDALKKLIQEDWGTNTTLQTNESGVTEVRAFRGDYQMTITLPDGSKHKTTGIVKKGSSRLKSK